MPLLPKTLWGDLLELGGIPTTVTVGGSQNTEM